MEKLNKLKLASTVTAIFNFPSGIFLKFLYVYETGTHILKNL